MPVTDTRSSPILKALGDNTRYAIYLELARSPRPLVDRRHRRVARPPPEHRAAPPRADARGRAARRPHRGHGRGRPAPAPVLAGRRRPVARARAAVVPAAGPACCSRPQRPPALRPTRPPRSDGPRAEPTAPATPTPRPASRRSSVELDVLGFDPAVDGTDDGESRSSPSPTARSVSWPRRIPSWCAPCTGAWSRASSSRRARRRSTTSTPSPTDEPCQVTIVPVR